MGENPGFSGISTMKTDLSLVKQHHKLNDDFSMWMVTTGQI